MDTQSHLGTRENRPYFSELVANEASSKKMVRSQSRQYKITTDLVTTIDKNYTGADKEKESDTDWYDSEGACRPPKYYAKNKPYYINDHRRVSFRRIRHSNALGFHEMERNLSCRSLLNTSHRSSGSNSTFPCQELDGGDASASAFEQNVGRYGDNSRKFAFPEMNRWLNHVNASPGGEHSHRRSLPTSYVRNLLIALRGTGDDLILGSDMENIYRERE